MDDDVQTVGDTLSDEVEEVTLPSRTYKVKDGHIIGMTDDYEAMVQAVDKVMKTERFVFPIYSDQYGNDFTELLGKSFDYAEVEVERMLKEALLADDRVNEVTIDNVERVDATVLEVQATVETIYGAVNTETEVQMGES
ncbi:DUF2634 domain-containing protein [Lactiplantibacillus herbarum]|uniref:DUF2634 domain-containing protein n=1 Tax=Lactiplantibacillus herbarum TaxID=1670446 RepID=UPI00064F2A8A|nr:DUF2634 domain-containing protein [Lactiplantibacillus herbarum]